MVRKLEEGIDESEGTALGRASPRATSSRPNSSGSCAARAVRVRPRRSDEEMGSHRRGIGTAAEESESAGYDGLWALEAGHDPFLQLAIAAEATERIDLDRDRRGVRPATR